MKTATDRICEALGWHLIPEIQFSGGTHRGFEAFNDAGVERETGEFIYSLVRILKPSYVVETGSHVGVGAAYIGLALRDNGGGKCDTIEFLDHAATAQSNMQKLGIEGLVTVHRMDAKDFRPNEQIGLLFLDTEPQTRFAELEKFYDSVSEGGFIIIHDLHRHMGQVDNEEHGFAWPWGKLPVFITDKLASGELAKFHFDTPRGLTCFYKRSGEDYGGN
jgi:predicted O-methyltransferase YrrM